MDSTRENMYQNQKKPQGRKFFYQTLPPWVVRRQELYFNCHLDQMFFWWERGTPIFNFASKKTGFFYWRRGSGHFWLSIIIKVSSVMPMVTGLTCKIFMNPGNWRLNLFVKRLICKNHTKILHGLIHIVHYEALSKLNEQKVDNPLAILSWCDVIKMKKSFSFSMVAQSQISLSTISRYLKLWNYYTSKKSSKHAQLGLMKKVFTLQGHSISILKWPRILPYTAFDKSDTDIDQCKQGSARQIFEGQSIFMTEKYLQNILKTFYHIPDFLRDSITIDSQNLEFVLNCHAVKWGDRKRLKDCKHLKDIHYGDVTHFEAKTWPTLI